MTEHFADHELVSPDTGQHSMDADFMAQIEELRTEYGKAMILTSAYRTPEHNAQVSSTGANGPHTTGRAVDVLVSGADAFDLIELAIEIGFTGIGIKQSGPHNKRFVHIDNLTEADGYPRPRVWTY